MEEIRGTGAGVFIGNTKSAEEVNIKIDVCQEDASIYNLIFKEYDEEKNE